MYCYFIHTVKELGVILDQQLVFW